MPAGDARQGERTALPDWTIGTASAPATTGAPGLDTSLPLITELRTGRHDDFVRMTLELQGDSGFPAHRARYVDRPLRECGSGRQIFPVGDGWLELRLEPAAAHTPEGRSTLSANEIPVEGELLLRIYRTCDFEGVVTLVLALTTPSPFRVFRPENPPRIVVDVRR